MHKNHLIVVWVQVIAARRLRARRFSSTFSHPSCDFLNLLAGRTRDEIHLGKAISSGLAKPNDYWVLVDGGDTLITVTCGSQYFAMKIEPRDLTARARRTVGTAVSIIRNVSPTRKFWSCSLWCFENGLPTRICEFNWNLTQRRQGAETERKKAREARPQTKVAVVAPRDERASETIQTLPKHRARYSVWIYD